MCTKNDCSPEGTTTLTRIRQSLTIINYQTGEEPFNESQPEMYFLSEQTQEKWDPISPVTSYTCPNGQVAQTHNFILGAGVKPGTYDLVTSQSGTEKNRLSVQTHSRNFDPASKPQTELDIIFNKEFELSGYDLDLSPRLPGDTIDVRTYWRTLQTMASHVVISLHLLDNSMMMVSQSDQPLGQYYPNVLWAPGEIVTDTHRLPLDAKTPPGLYTVELNLYDGSLNTFKPLSMTSGETAQPFDHNPILGKIRILDVAQEKLPAYPVDAKLGGEIQLSGYDLAVSDLVSNVSLTLYWRAIGQPQKDYTVFTQLIGPDGKVWAQQDNQPQAGRYPTTVWQIGDKVIDRYDLVLKEKPPAGKYQLLIGMYDWVTGDRLKASGKDGNSFSDNAVLLTQIKFE